MNDIMEYFVESANLKEELNQAELSMNGLYLEKEGLREERNEAYRTCQVLQRELDFLQQSLEIDT